MWCEIASRNKFCSVNVLNECTYTARIDTKLLNTHLKMHIFHSYLTLLSFIALFIPTRTCTHGYIRVNVPSVCSTPHILIHAWMFKHHKFYHLSTRTRRLEQCQNTHVDIESVTIHISQEKSTNTTQPVSTNSSGCALWSVCVCLRHIDSGCTLMC